MKEPPPQTWGSLFKGRMVAWGVVFSSFKAIGALSSALGKPHALPEFERKFADKACAILHKPTEIMTEGGMVESRASKVARIAALDSFATVAATILLYTGSRFFAKQREAHKEHTVAAAASGEAQVPPVSASAQPAAVPATTIHEASATRLQESVLARGSA